MSAVNIYICELKKLCKKPGTEKKEYISNTQGHPLRRFH